MAEKIGTFCARGAVLFVIERHPVPSPHVVHLHASARGSFCPWRRHCSRRRAGSGCPVDAHVWLGLPEFYATLTPGVPAVIRATLRGTSASACARSEVWSDRIREIAPTARDHSPSPPAVRATMRAASRSPGRAGLRGETRPYRGKGAGAGAGCHWQCDAWAGAIADPAFGNRRVRTAATRPWPGTARVDRGPPAHPGSSASGRHRGGVTAGCRSRGRRAGHPCPRDKGAAVAQRGAADGDPGGDGLKV